MHENRVTEVAKESSSEYEVLSVKKAPTKVCDSTPTAKNRSGCSTGSNSGC